MPISIIIITGAVCQQTADVSQEQFNIIIMESILFEVDFIWQDCEKSEHEGRRRVREKERQTDRGRIKRRFQIDSLLSTITFIVMNRRMMRVNISP